MEAFDIEPWPSTYVQGECLSPSKLVANCDGREVGAFRCAIPPLTVEPPQVHLISPRDGRAFQELLTGFDRNLVVGYYDVGTGKYDVREYFTGEDVVIPAFRIHWLANLHGEPLNFVCEYAPHPWDGDVDEPEFENLGALLRFAEEKGLMEEIMRA